MFGVLKKILGLHDVSQETDLHETISHEDAAQIIAQMLITQIGKKITEKQKKILSGQMTPALLESLEKGMDPMEALEAAVNATPKLREIFGDKALDQLGNTDQFNAELDTLAKLGEQNVTGEELKALQNRTRENVESVSRGTPFCNDPQYEYNRNSPCPCGGDHKTKRHFRNRDELTTFLKNREKELKEKQE